MPAKKSTTSPHPPSSVAKKSTTSPRPPSSVAKTSTKTAKKVVRKNKSVAGVPVNATKSVGVTKRVIPYTFTQEQRVANLAKALDSRKKRAAIKVSLANGKETFRHVLETGKDGNNAIYGRMRVEQVLRSLPQVGPAKAQEFMGDMLKRRTVMGLKDATRNRLIGEVETFLTRRASKHN